LIVIRRLPVLICLFTLGRAQTPPPDQIYSFDPKIVHLPVPVQIPEAEMPDQARRQQLAGLCAVALIIDKRGFPQDPHVVRSTDPMFAENSLNAVKQYRFKPATTLQDDKPVLFSMHVEINYRFGRDPDPILLPPPHIRLGFLLSAQPDSPAPNSDGAYTLSHRFDAPNSLPKLQRFANAGFGRAAFSLEDGAGCDAILTIDETGHPSNVQIVKCDYFSLQEPTVRSLLKSRFLPAILNGNPVMVRAGVRLVCDGF